MTWAIPEKIQTGVLRTQFLEKDLWNFQICHFTVGNSRQNEASPLEIPQNCVTSIGISKAKSQDPWNSTFYLFSAPAWKFHNLNPPV